jgi:hypothetical protein
MSSIAHDVLAAVAARLRADPTNGVDSASIRVDHRTPVDRESAPAVHVIADEDVLQNPKCGGRSFAFRVVVAVRDDAGTAALDAILVAVMERLDPATVGLDAYPAGVRVKASRIRFDHEVADADAHEAAIACAADYETGDEWSLGG